MNRSFSARARAAILEDLESATFDVLVIGGGITGAGIAWDAAKRGMKTALIERNDFAFGSSGRSTKLIHGGLHSLKKGEFKLVRQIGREREWLHRHAPHLVTPMSMLLPIYKGGALGYWSTSIGLALYDRLAGVRKSERRIMHKTDVAIRMEPLLKLPRLKGAGSYYEYLADDARLTIEVLKTAAKHGAWAINYVEATGFMYYQTKICGVRAVDRLTGKEVEIRAKRVVNAAGPWVDPVRSKDHAVKGKKLLLTKGVHLVVDHSKLPVRQGIYFDVPDNRMIFVIPRDGKTYIGATETVYTGDPDRPRTTEADREYLLGAVRDMFPECQLDTDDVEAMWAGLRPLISEDGQLPSDVCRKDEIWESASGLITIAGGKLTGFRLLARKAVDYIADSLAKEARQAFGPCTTWRETISGGDSGRCETFWELREQLIQHGLRKGLTPETASYLVRLYGSNAAEIYMRMDGLENRFAELAKPFDAAAKVIAPDTPDTPDATDMPDATDAPVTEGRDTFPESEQVHRTEPEALPYTEAAYELPETEPWAEPEGAEAETAADAAEEYAVRAEEAVYGHHEDQTGESSQIRYYDPEWNALAAEIDYCIEEEMAVHAADFLVRRTGLLYFDRETTENIALDVLDIMADRLGWDDDEMLSQKRRLALEWEDATISPGKNG